MFAQLGAKTNEEMPSGIIFLDEIDKLVENEPGTNHGFFGEKKQDELIGWLEEATITTDSKQGQTLNTKNILFVAAGTFKGIGARHALEEIIIKRTCGGKKEIGFEAGMQEEKKQIDRKDLLKKVRPSALRRYFGASRTGLTMRLADRAPKAARRATS